MTNRLPSLQAETLERYERLPPAPYQSESTRAKMLAESAFLPAPGDHWDAVPIVANLTHTLVIADFGLGYLEYQRRSTEIADSWSAERHRALPEELVPPRWKEPAERPDLASMARLVARMRERGPFPFYEWLIEKADRKAVAATGREKSARRLLYLSDEALYTYQGLYLCRGISPKFLVLPRTDEGPEDWFAFLNPGSPFARAVLGGPGPEFLIQHAPEPRWPEYATPARLPGLPPASGLHAFTRNP